MTVDCCLSEPPLASAERPAQSAAPALTSPCRDRRMCGTTPRKLMLHRLLRPLRLAQRTFVSGVKDGALPDEDTFGATSPLLKN